ncbi:barstar family protein [Streptomyces polyrhachis]|uniref:Barstar family protein n=1 Tax=Streptomyces polyrhachis TaxID=1282885 RepID=A0ABW2GKB7_9ACTN
MSHATLAQAVQSAGWKVLALDLAAVTDEQGFLERCASTLGLPPAAARNWDAFQQASGTLGWGPEVPGRLLVVVGWPAFAAAQPQQWQHALQQLESLAGRQRQYDSTLAIVLAIA